VNPLANGHKLDVNMRIKVKKTKLNLYFYAIGAAWLKRKQQQKGW
jgi:hypothetical protein